MKKLLSAMVLAASISGCYSQMPEPKVPVFPILKMECSHTTLENSSQASDATSCYCYDRNKELTKQYYKC